MYPPVPAEKRKPIRVLSLFDGIATGGWGSLAPWPLQGAPPGCMWDWIAGVRVASGLRPQGVDRSLGVSVGNPRCCLYPRGPTLEGSRKGAALGGGTGGDRARGLLCVLMATLHGSPQAC